MPIDAMTFEQLDALRECLQLPQIKLCQRGDLNPTTYTRWLRWARGEPNGSRPHPRSLKAVREVLKSELTERQALLGDHPLPEGVRPAAA